MIKIIIKGKAETDSPLRDCDGIECEDAVFSDYFRKGTYQDVVTGGHMYFKHEGRNLITYTEYESSRVLTQTELDDLADYTQGQWSDGIGEGFEQNPCGVDSDRDDIYISPWGEHQKVIVEQYTFRKEKLERIING